MAEPANRLQDSRPGQLLQNLREQGHRQAISVSDLLRAGRRSGRGGEVAKGDQPVIRFFGQLEHWNEDLSGRKSHSTPPSY